MICRLGVGRKIDSALMVGGLRLKSYVKKNLPNKPLCSVITVVYNGEKYLEETILSVINQTYNNIEYIIIDGGSTDGTLDVIRKYEYAIDYWLSEKDKGIYDAMNKGIKLSSGEIIGLINADDFYELDAISNMIESFTTSKSDIYFGNKRLINENFGVSKITSIEMPASLKEVSIHSVHPTVFVRKDYYAKHIFSTVYPISADYNFFLEAYLNNAAFYKVDKVIANMRVGGVSSNFNFDMARIKIHYFGYSYGSKFLIRYVLRYNLSRLVKKVLPRSFIKRMLLNAGYK